MNRLEFLAALKVVIPGVSHGETLLTGTDAFVFRNGMIQTFNEHICVTFPLDIGVEGAVKATEMAKVLEKMSADEIEIEKTENALVINDGNTTLSMILLEIETMLSSLVSLALDEIDWEQIPPDFMKALEACWPSVSKNPTHEAMMGIRFDGEDVLSCDRFRCAWYKIKANLPAFTLSGSAAAELRKIPDLTSFALTPNWVHFLNKDQVFFSSKLIAYEFPTEALKKLFSQKPDQTLYHFPTGMEKALDRAEVLAYSQESGLDYVTLKVQNGKLVIKGERQYGSIRERLPLEAGDWPEGLELHIQPKSLKDILARTRDFQYSDSKVYFQAGKFRHVICTIVPDEKPEPYTPPEDFENPIHEPIEGDDIPF